MQYKFEEILLIHTKEKKELSGLHPITGHLYSNQKPVELIGLKILFTGYLFNFNRLKQNKFDNVEKLIADYYIHDKLEKMIAEFEGYFCAVIIDGSKVTCIMDKYGIETGYYYNNKEELEFVFSTSLPLMQDYCPLKFNKEYLASYFIYPSMPFKFSLYENIDRLKRGEYLNYDKNNTVKVKEYDYLDDLASIINNSRDLDDQDIIKNIEKELISLFSALREEVKSIEDVEIYNQLSGGVDSTLLQVILSKAGFKNSYCYNLKGHGQDGEYSLDTARLLESEHDIYDVDIGNLIDYKKNAISMIKLPQVAIGESMMNYAFNNLRNSNKRVISICGNGSDALFCHGRELKVLKAYDKFPFLTKTSIKIFAPFNKKIEKISPLLNRNRNLENEDVYKVFGSLNTKGLIHENYVLSSTDRKRQSLYSFPGRLIDKRYLMRVFEGEVSEQNQIYYKMAKNNRVMMFFPMIKENVVKFLLKIPIQKKIKNFESKYFAKKYLEKNIPKKYIYRKKIGKNPPWKQILKNVNEEDFYSFYRNEISDLINIEELRNTYGKPGYEGLSLKFQNLYNLHRNLID